VLTEHRIYLSRDIGSRHWFVSEALLDARRGRDTIEASAETGGIESPVNRNNHQARTASGFKRCWSLVFGAWCLLGPPDAIASESLGLNWTNNLLTISGPKLPGG